MGNKEMHKEAGDLFCAGFAFFWQFSGRLFVVWMRTGVCRCESDTGGGKGASPTEAARD